MVQSNYLLETIKKLFIKFTITLTIVFDFILYIPD